MTNKLIKPIETKEISRLYRNWISYFTIAKKEITPKLYRAKELQPSITIKNYADARFERISDPQPVGFGNDDFVFCNWKRIK